MSRKRLEAESSFTQRLQAGDHEAFRALVDDLHGPMVALARTFTRSHTLAEDIVQETWLAVIRGLHQFEGRSTLRTWVYSILVKRARTIAAREARRPGSPFSPTTTSTSGTAAVEWEPGQGRIGLWDEAPVPWVLEDPAAVFQTREALEVIHGSLRAMPPRQRQVILLRDVEDLPPEEVCNILHLTGTNLRVMLHRARARVRRDLDRYVRNGVRAQARPRPDALAATANDGESS